jgi:hypothetical protein
VLTQRHEERRVQEPREREHRKRRLEHEPQHAEDASVGLTRDATNRHRAARPHSTRGTEFGSSRERARSSGPERTSCT